MSVESIPQEVLIKAEVLGYLPEEYVEPAAQLIEEASKTQELDELVATIDDILPKFTDFAADSLFRRLLFKGNIQKVKNAIFNSKEVAAWVKRNRDRLMASIHTK